MADHNILDQPDQPEKNNRFKTISNLVYKVAAVSIVVGALFKVQHWPGGTLLLWGGIGLFVLHIVLNKYNQ